MRLSIPDVLHDITHLHAAADEPEPVIPGLPGRPRTPWQPLIWGLRGAAIVLLGLPLLAMALVLNIDQAISFEPPLVWVTDLYVKHAQLLTGCAVAASALASVLSLRQSRWHSLTALAVAMWLVWTLLR